jgi:hypothetical protein
MSIPLSAETKLRMLALLNAPLVADLSVPAGPNAFRWYDTQLAQGSVEVGTSVRVQRASTIRTYTMRGLVNVSLIRFQIDVVDFDPEVTRAVTKDLIAFMATVDLVSNAQFLSPAGTPPQFPCFLLNERHTMYPKLPNPAHVETTDWRIANNESF